MATADGDPMGDPCRTWSSSSGDIPLMHGCRMTPCPGLRRPRPICSRPSGDITASSNWSTVSWWRKRMGFRESLLAVALIGVLRAFVVPRNLGVVSGADGDAPAFPGPRPSPGCGVRLMGPLPRPQDPRRADPDLAPDLVVEVLSESNTAKEMKRKRGEYFVPGCRRSSGRSTPGDADGRLSIHRDGIADDA